MQRRIIKHSTPNCKSIYEQYKDPAYRQLREARAREHLLAERAARIAKCCLASFAVFDEIEHGFLRAMSHCRKASDKQITWLERLAERSGCGEGL